MGTRSLWALLVVVLALMYATLVVTVLLKADPPVSSETTPIRIIRRNVYDTKSVTCQPGPNDQLLSPDQTQQSVVVNGTGHEHEVEALREALAVMVRRYRAVTREMKRRPIGE